MMVALCLLPSGGQVTPVHIFKNGLFQEKDTNGSWVIETVPVCGAEEEAWFVEKVFRTSLIILSCR